LARFAGSGCRRALVALGLIVVVLVVPSSAGASSPAAMQPAATPEQQLADRYAPIVMLKRQEAPCDRNGEAYLPAPVEVVFDDPQVALVRAAGRSVSNNDLIMIAPTVPDLAEGEEDEAYHLDFPGNPRNPGCGYEQWFRARMAGHTPVTYANVVVGEDRVALQYWFWYVFNDFNNTHEGDWERIQLIFDATSVEEALTEPPVEVGYSQHAGGERADWDDDKLSREGNRPIVYAAAGSHASKFGSGVYLGWGEDAAGFGCDVTTGPSDRVEPEVILLPNDISEATGPLAWLAWDGRWGERQRSFYNGPGGPGVRGVWTDPFPWQDERLRDSSIEIPDALTFGPGPTVVFCNVTEFASLLLTRVVVYPWLVALVLVSIVVLAIALSWLGGRILVSAWRLYLRHGHVFVPLGLMLIPIGLAAGSIQFLFVDYPPGKQVLDLFDRGPGARFALVLTIGGMQQVINYLIVGPSVIEAVGEIRSGRRPSFVSTYREVFRRLKQLALAVGGTYLVVALLAITVVGIPVAIWLVVRWIFVSQAVILDDVGPRQAVRLSEQTVKGHWWRTAAASALLAAVGAWAAPLLGILCLVLLNPGIRYVNWLSSLVYAVMVPISVIGLTLLYYQARGEPAPVSAAPLAAPGDVSAPLPAAPPA
jgi:hypothetical protein